MKRVKESERSSRATASNQPMAVNEYLESLIKMRNEDPRRYRLNTSVATRRTIEIYEQQKEQAKAA